MKRNCTRHLPWFRPVKISRHEPSLLSARSLMGLLCALPAKQSIHRPKPQRLRSISVFVSRNERLQLIEGNAPGTADEDGADFAGVYEAVELGTAEGQKVGRFFNGIGKFKAGSGMHALIVLRVLKVRRRTCTELSFASTRPQQCHQSRRMRRRSRFLIACALSTDSMSRTTFT